MTIWTSFVSESSRFDQEVRNFYIVVRNSGTAVYRIRKSIRCFCEQRIKLCIQANEGDVEFAGP